MPEKRTHNNISSRDKNKPLNVLGDISNTSKKSKSTLNNQTNISPEMEYAPSENCYDDLLDDKEDLFPGLLYLLKPTILESPKVESIEIQEAPPLVEVLSDWDDIPSNLDPLETFFSIFTTGALF
eukprot:GHVP01000130.1.p3 GENE.GHVP01000130.1~~GHVP01000130.1.p3  ORF type:complete len:125 (+),score=36.84 GHVP01000130.1:171-545(+)